MKKISFHTLPALWVGSIYAFGIFIGKKLELDFSNGFLIVIVMFVTATMFFIRSQRRPHLNVFLSISLIALVLSIGITKIHFDSFPNAVLKDSILVRPATIIGRVADAPVTVENRTRLLLRMEVLEKPEIALSGEPTVLVTLIRQRRDSLALSLVYGNRIKLTGQLYRPSPERNPGEFDSRVYYEAQGIGLLMRVRGYSNVAIVDSLPSLGMYDGLMRHVVLPIRNYTVGLIDRTIGGEEGEFLKGMLIGERGGIPYSTRTAFTNSGIAHILAVSGAHVAVVFAFFTALFSLLRFSRNTNVIFTCFVLVLYMTLTGSHPPIVRATVMTLILLAGKIFGEKSNALNSLGVAAIVILTYDARQLFDVGFQLSFLAVLSIVYLYPIINTWISRIRSDHLWQKTILVLLRASAVSVVATLGTLPLTAMYFGKVSVVGLLTNAIILPIVGISIMLGFVSSLVGWASFVVADAFAAVNGLLLSLSLALAKFSGGLPWAYVETLRFKPLYAIPYFATLGVLFHLHSKSIARKMFIGLVASLNLLLFTPLFSSDKSTGTLRVSFIDVGQGDAALLEFPDGKTMLIDGGPRTGDNDSGERTVAPFLKRRGIQKIDYLISSHPHNDHIGGFPYIFRMFDVNEVMESGQPARDPIYQEYIQAVHDEHCKVDTVRAGASAFQIGDARVYVLYPTPAPIDADTSHTYTNLNNTSVVLKVCYRNTSILFTGDAERDAEKEILHSYGDFLQSMILKAGHHGSNTSSSQEFLDEVKPAYAIISVGLHNKFNHPSEDVLERLHTMNVETLRTDEEGAIIFESDGESLKRIEWR